MKLTLFFLLVTFTHFLSFTSYAMPDKLRMDDERIIYWQEKKLGRKLSTYEKSQLLNSYIVNSGKLKSVPSVSVFNQPRRINHSHSKISSFQSVNDTLSKVNILAILVDFPDLKSSSPGLEPEDTDMFYDNYSLDHYKNLLFSTSGYLGPNNENLMTARQYYQKVTGDYFDLNGDVYGWITVSKNAEYYGNRNGTERDANVSELVIEAVESLVRQGVDLSPYDQTDLNDVDGDGVINEPDGVIDHILLFHSSIGEEAGGGVLGQNAIWSHRFFVTENNQPKQITGSDLKAFNYTINPIDAGIGVVVHEFGHDLGLPDEYDLKDISIGEPVANWSVMSSGSWMGELRGSKPVMFSPKNLDFLQNRFGGKWVNQTSVNLTSLNTSTRFDLAHRGVHTGENNQIKIILPSLLEDFIKPNSGNSQYYSGEGNKINNQMSFSLTLPEASTISLQMLSQFSIESNYDIFQVYVNSNPVAGNATKDSHPTYPNIRHYLDGNSFAGDKVSGEFVNLSYDLSQFSGQQATITFLYQSDEAVSYFGIVIDDIKVTADNNVIYIDTAENNNTVQLNGFRKIGQYKSGAEHAYYLQLRSHQGIDEGLKLSQYPAGLTLWYSNENYDNNNTSEHPGYGDLLLIDTDQRPIYKTDGVSPAISAIQVRDAALRLIDQTAGLGDDNLSPSTSFSDRKDYSFSIQAESGVNLPQYGINVELIDVSEDFDKAQIQIGYDRTYSISFKASNKTVLFSPNGFVLEESDSFEWTFSDGQQSKELYPEIEFESYKTYDVTFKQIKLSGEINEVELSINLTRPLTITNFNVSHANGVLTGTVDVEAGLEPYSIEWDFGDGNKSTGASITHTYEVSGTYTVSVKITDGNGETVTQSKQFTLTVPLSIEPNLSSNSLTLTANAKVSGGSGKYQVDWDYGDGNSGEGLSISHTYNSAGTYNVSVIVTDTDTNQSESKSEQVTISLPQSQGSSSGGSIYYLLLLVSVAIRRAAK
ncbi:peptidase M6 [Pseudoalteromonas phenolica]|uniref:Peptidase M6 n=1 Tax=Pseudoalteromonas phenolica TaxID=161398 RepID=A0A4Q7IPY8_9GAMM|nr:immune inhibitor A domain-containing protein [Pseudoalteromonas phenolica]RZQ53981.1 peptidase M6 [Pseudoalteromonas phenolica]